MRKAANCGSANKATNQNGDGARWIPSSEAARLFDLYGNNIYRLAYSYVHDKHSAEDVLQDTLVQFLRTQPMFNGPEHEKAWLMRVAVNVSKNLLKSQRIRRADELDDQLIGEDDESLSYVWEAVRDLPEPQREVIHLYYQEGYTSREIAQILDRSESTVRSDLARGRSNLKEVLQKAYDFD